MLSIIANILTLVSSEPILPDQQSLQTIAATMAKRVISYYVPNEYGYFPKDNGETVQYFESGMIWGFMLEHAQITRDESQVPIVIQEIVKATYGPTGDLLGPKEFQNAISALEGKWNDDILWWYLLNVLNTG
jgi:hypothetical protein